MLKTLEALLMVLHRGIEGFVGLAQCFGNGILDSIDLLVQALDVVLQFRTQASYFLRHRRCNKLFEIVE